MHITVMCRVCKTGPEGVQMLPECLRLTGCHRTEGYTATEVGSIVHLTV